MEEGGPSSCLVHHTRARRHLPAPNRVGFGASLNSPFGIKTLSFLHRLPSFMTVRRTDMTLPSIMTIPNSHEQVYIKTTPSLILTYKIYIFIHFHTLCLRETEFCKQFGSTANKRSAFCLLGDHFILGDKLPKSRSTTARAIIVLRRLCPTQDLICKQVLINLIFILVSLQTISCTRFVLVLFYSTEN